MLQQIDNFQVLDSDITLDEAERIYQAEIHNDDTHRAAMEDWVGVVASMWDLIGKPVDEKRLNLYCRQLQIVPLGLLEKGIEYAIRNNTYNNVPPIGSIWEGVRAELEFLNLTPGTDIKIAIEKWSARIFERGVHRFGSKGEL